MINIRFGSCCFFFSSEVAQQHPLATKGPASSGVCCYCVLYLYNFCHVMVWFNSYSFELHYFTVSCFYSVLLQYFMKLFYCTSWDWIAWLFFSIITEIIILSNIYCYVVHFKCKASLFISDCWLFDSTNQSLLFRFIKDDWLFNSFNYKFVVHLFRCSVWLISCNSFLL